MKKKSYWLSASLLVAVSASLLAGCSSSSMDKLKNLVESSEKTSNQTSSTSQDSSTSAKEVEHKMGEVVQVGDVEYTVLSKEVSTNVGGEYGRNANGQYVILTVTVKNNGKKSITITDDFFKLLQGEVEFDSDSTASIYAQDDHSAKFFWNDLNPGNSLTGKVVFDVSPETAAATDLKVQVQTGLWGTQKGVISLN